MFSLGCQSVGPQIVFDEKTLTDLAKVEYYTNMKSKELIQPAGLSNYLYYARNSFHLIYFLFEFSCF